VYVCTVCSYFIYLFFWLRTVCECMCVLCVLILFIYFFGFGLCVSVCVYLCVPILFIYFLASDFFFGFRIFFFSLPAPFPYMSSFFLSFFIGVEVCTV